jgi:hypothetical protein
VADEIAKNPATGSAKVRIQVVLLFRFIVLLLWICSF